MKYIDPREAPNKWLSQILLNMIDEDSEESRENLRRAITFLAWWIEPGLIDSAFEDWIEEYLRLLAEHENNQNNVPHECSQEHQSVCGEQSQIDSEVDPLRKVDGTK